MAEQSETVSSYVEMIATLRTFLDTLAAAKPDEPAIADLKNKLQDLSRTLARLAVAEKEQLYGQLRNYPDRGQATQPVVIVDTQNDDEMRGRVTFGRFFLGRGGAAHGGSIAFLFDDMLGRLANAPPRATTRTAYLHIDFRALVPIETELQVRAQLVSEVGRKRMMRGTISLGDIVCAEAEGLFVVPKLGFAHVDGAAI